MKHFLKEKSKQLSLLMFDIFDDLQAQKEYIISNQLIRSVTSIGANIAESVYAEMKRDYIHKLAIALKEAVESEYWIELLEERHYSLREFQKLKEYNAEIIRLLIASIKKLKRIC